MDEFESASNGLSRDELRLNKIQSEDEWLTTPKTVLSPVQNNKSTGSIHLEFVCSKTYDNDFLEGSAVDGNHSNINTSLYDRNGNDGNNGNNGNNDSIGSNNNKHKMHCNKNKSDFSDTGNAVTSSHMHNLKDVYVEDLQRIKTNTKMASKKEATKNILKDLNSKNSFNIDEIKHNKLQTANIPNVHFGTFPRTASPNAHFWNHTDYSKKQKDITSSIKPVALCDTGNSIPDSYYKKERNLKDLQVANALHIISQSMVPPAHNVDKYRDWVLDKLKKDEDQYENNSKVYKAVNFILGTPFVLIRIFWHYVILEVHIAYNLTLLFATFFTTPQLIFFIIGVAMFWTKVLYELYRDIMHRDDPLYASNVPKEMSIAAAISASFGFLLKMKAQNGEITEAWWRGEK